MTTIKPAYWLWPLTFLILVWADVGWAADVIDTMNTADTELRDAFLNSSAENLINTGGMVTFSFGDDGTPVGRALFWFADTSDLGITNVDSVVACTLVIEKSGACGTNPPDSVWVHRILPWLAPNWEGNNNYATSDSAEVNSSARFYMPGAGPPDDTLWNTGGASTEGTDYRAGILGAANVNVSNGTVVKIPLDRPTLDSMFLGSAGYGWLRLRMNDETTNCNAASFHSSEAASEADRPRLIIAYDTVGGAPPPVTAFGAGTYGAQTVGGAGP